MARIERSNEKYNRQANKIDIEDDEIFGRGKCRCCGEDEVEGGLDGGKCLYCGFTTNLGPQHAKEP